ncbi:unnamed protein product [Vitrella brassicaformis CCMP3155]|uniref:UBA domain-containing protein n=2 Tax=Vitrella brassicaformis TaxID=1169539 RepID=A0A0G4E8K8_VITBC|nr:unnamed protein product [Vitrella brassicaformis CCMP3155]|eukprot:CEL91836.1 unnamed protein product [Vitrella brassicaformis CCMP3155]
MAKSSVQLRVYDLSQGMARQMSLPLLGMQIDYLPHTGLHVFGREYFFGGGIQVLTPSEVESTYGMRPVEIIPLGDTEVAEEAFHAYLHETAHMWTENTYNLLSRNCNNFTDEAAKFLLGKGIPEHIVNLPQRVSSTPLGAMIASVMGGMQQSMQQHLHDANQQSIWTAGPTGPSIPAAMSDPPLSHAGGDEPIDHAIAVMMVAVDASEDTGGKKAKARATEALRILLNLAANISKHPDEAKYRTVKKDNKKMQTSLLNIDGAADAMAAIGFEEATNEEGEGVWRFNDEKTGGLAAVEGRIKAHLDHVEALRPVPAAAPAAPVVAPPAPRAAVTAGASTGGDDLAAYAESLRNDPAAMEQFMNDPAVRAAAATNPALAAMLQNPATLRDQLGNVQTGTQQQQQQQQTNPVLTYDHQLKQLEAMGFSDRESNLRALQSVGGNVNAALDRLLAGGG